MRLVMLRHAATAGNEKRRYVGRRTDEPLSERGREQCARFGTFGQVKTVHTSPMLRARQTARLCFPNARIVPTAGLEEFDFGVFEGRTAQQMGQDEAYLSWVNSGCLTPCPGGESLDAFAERSNAALVGVLYDARQHGENQVVVVTHGGNIMAAFHIFARASKPNAAFYDWHVGNCEGYSAAVELVDKDVSLIDVRPVGGTVPPPFSLGLGDEKG